MLYKTWNVFVFFQREKKNENSTKSIQFEWSDSSSISSSSTWWKKKINNGEKSNEEIKCCKEKEINFNHLILKISYHCLSTILYHFSSFFHSMIILTFNQINSIFIYFILFQFILIIHSIFINSFKLNEYQKWLKSIKFIPFHSSNIILRK